MGYPLPPSGYKRHSIWLILLCPAEYISVKIVLAAKLRSQSQSPVCGFRVMVAARADNNDRHRRRPKEIFMFQKEFPNPLPNWVLRLLGGGSFPYSTGPIGYAGTGREVDYVAAKNMISLVPYTRCHEDSWAGATSPGCVQDVYKTCSGGRRPYGETDRSLYQPVLWRHWR